MYKRRQFRLLAAPAVVSALLAFTCGFVLGRVTQVVPLTFPEPSPPAQSTGKPSRYTTQRDQLAAAADFIITDSNLAARPSHQDLREGPLASETCVGDVLRVANASHQTVGLAATPEESDARVELGIVQPGGVFTFDTRLVKASPGRFFLHDAEGNLLSRYDVRNC